ncbi:MAG TPA: sodium-dependent transporter [Tissierellia bacterium]|nr:sodium-dependent transporter [Tissierellia bacterium]
METKREQWGTRFGFIMAAAGSAVGLGNIWRFPYLTGANGGGAFILIYLGFIFLIGSTVMLAEFTVGRMTQKAAVGAYKSVSRNWTFAGVMGVLSAFLIMGFYPVVGGWATAYILKSVTGLLSDSAAIGDAFGAFISAPIQPLLWTVLFMLFNIFIVIRGVGKGIEMASKVLMPLLIILLLSVAGYGLTLPGAQEGIRFLFVPDFSAVTGNTFLSALGQAFFSLSLGMGCMVTYGSYLPKDSKLPSSAGVVTVMDTFFAILAGVAIFPALFAFGMEPAVGPGLVFVVVPQIFARMGFIGPVLSLVFFVALMIAALTSSVSLLEVVVAYLMDEKKWQRSKAVIATGLVMLVLCSLASLSLGIWSGWTIPGLGVGFFDFFDILTDKVFLAIGGLFLAVFAGFQLKKEDLYRELTNHGETTFPLFDAWYFLLKFIVPVAIGIVAIFGLLDIEQPVLMITGLVIIGLLALFSKKL